MYGAGSRSPPPENGLTAAADELNLNGYSGYLRLTALESDRSRIILPWIDKTLREVVPFVA